MSERIERRKEIFKSVHSSSNMSSSTKKCSEYSKKGLEKRSHLILAKRFKPSIDNLIDDIMIDNNANSDVQHSDQYLYEIIMKSKSTDKATQYEGLKIMRKILGSETPHIGIFAEKGVILLLSKLLMNTNENIRIEAAWCLTNIATGNHAETGLVLPAVPNMIEILSSDNIDKDSIALKEQICWTIGNIAGDCDEYRTILHANGCLMIILKFLESSFKAIQSLLQKSSSQSFLSSSNSTEQMTQSALQTAAWTISNLARGTISGSYFVNTGKLPYLVDLMSITMLVPLTQSQIQISSPLLAASEEIWWLFAFLTAKEDTTVDYLLSLNLCGGISIILAQFIQQFDISTTIAMDSTTISIIPLIRCLGNITSGPVVWLNNIVANTNILEALLFFTNINMYTIGQSDLKKEGIQASYRAIIKETLWVVSNILGTIHSRNIMLDYKSSSHMKQQQQNNILSNITNALLYDDFNIQQEAIYCIEQACLEPNSLHHIIHHNEFLSILHRFDTLLRIPGSIDIPMATIRIINALTTYSPDISNQCVDVGITETLENIQYNCNNEELGELAYTLITKFYKYLETEDIMDNEVDTTNKIDNNIFNNNSKEINYSQNVTNVFNFSIDHNINNNIQTTPILNTNTHLNDNSPTTTGSGRGRGLHLLQPSWMTNNNIL